MTATEITQALRVGEMEAIDFNRLRWKIFINDRQVGSLVKWMKHRVKWAAYLYCDNSEFSNDCITGLGTTPMQAMHDAMTGGIIRRDMKTQYVKELTSLHGSEILSAMSTLNIEE